ncbi:MAG: tetratricopeptide repeat protein [Candidatus Thorarchaeota archaeon]
MTKGENGIIPRLQHAEELLQQGYYDEALQMIEKLKNSNDLKDEELLRATILKSQILTSKRSFQDGLRIAEKALIQSQQLNKPLSVVDAYIAKAEALVLLGNADESLAMIEQGEISLSTCLEEHQASFKQKKALLALFRGFFHERKNNLDKAMDYFQQCLALNEDLGDKFQVVRSLANIGRIHFYKGSLDQALELYQRCLTLSEELSNKHHISRSLNNIGSVWATKGNLDRALKCYQQALKIEEELGNKDALLLNNLGMISRVKGDLDQALEYQHRALEIYEEFGDKRQIAWVQGTLGITCHEKGEADQALIWLEQSLAQREKLGNQLGIAEGLFDLVIVTVEAGFLKQARKSVLRLQQINAQGENKLINHFSLVAEALVLKTSPRMRDKARAQEFLQLVAEGEMLNFDATSKAMLNLCELLLFEGSASREEEVLQEAKALIQKLYALAQGQCSFSLVVDALLLQAKFALIEGDLAAAAQFLGQASITAEENGIGRQIEAVAAERQRLEAQYDTWQRLLQDNAPFQTRLEQAQLASYFKDALKLASVASGR